MNARAEVSPGRGPDVHLPVQIFGWRLPRAGNLPRANVVAVNIDVGDLPQFAAAQEAVASLEQMGSAAPLQPHLHRAAILPRRCHHGLPFYDVITDRLLDVHVRGGLAGLHAGQTVPVVGRADQHDGRTELPRAVSDNR